MEVIVYSSKGCPYCEKVKSALKEWGIEYEERNVSVVKEYFDELREKKIMGTPATYVNGKLILGFQEKKFRKALGLPLEGEQKGETQKVEQTDDKIFSQVTKENLDEEYDFVMIGGGPAGASAAVYSARAKLKTLVIDKAPKAGTLAITHKIANYPGVRGELTGLELLEVMQKQAKDFGAQFVRSNVLSVDFSGDVKKINLPEGTIKAKSVFIAVGAKAPGSKIKGEEEFTGRGVSYCSTCDAAFYEDRTVVVAGENEEALHEAEMLAKFCKEVKLLLPTENVKGDANLDELEELKNVSVYKRHRIREIKGNDSVEQVIILDNNRQEQTWDVDGVFLYLGGMRPGTDFLGNEIARDSEGYVIVEEFLRTNIDGIFAGGDARRTPIKQAVVSAADGAIAAMGADQHVNKRLKMRPQYS